MDLDTQMKSVTFKRPDVQRTRRGITRTALEALAKYKGRGGLCRFFVKGLNCKFSHNVDAAKVYKLEHEDDYDDDNLFWTRQYEKASANF